MFFFSTNSVIKGEVSPTTQGINKTKKFAGWQFIGSPCDQNNGDDHDDQKDDHDGQNDDDDHDDQKDDHDDRNDDDDHDVFDKLPLISPCDVFGQVN